MVAVATLTTEACVGKLRISLAVFLMLYHAVECTCIKTYCLSGKILYSHPFYSLAWPGRACNVHGFQW